MKQVDNFLKTCIPFVAAVILAGGCKSKPEPEGYQAGEAFMVEGETSTITRLADTQIAAGARADGTLRPYHFRDAALNSLGREKLDFMLKDGEGEGELVVYVDVPAGEGEAGKALADSRRDAVAQYLKSVGRAENSFRLESGFNPNNTMTASGSKAGGDDKEAAATPEQKFGAAAGDYLSAKTATPPASK